MVRNLGLVWMSPRGSQQGLHNLLSFPQCLAQILAMPASGP
jgi:hypothetical protein